MINRSLLAKVKLENPSLATLLEEQVREIEIAQRQIEQQAELIDKLFNGLRHPCARVTWAAAGQSIPNDTATNVTFDTVSIDTDSMFDAAVDNTKLVIHTEGYYIFGGSIRWATEATGLGLRRIRVTRNDGNTSIQDIGAASITDTLSNSAVGFDFMVKNDYIRIKAHQKSGAALLLSVGVGTPSMFAVRVVDPVIISLYQQSLGRKVNG